MGESFDISEFTPGQITKGKVILVGERDVFVDCGFKSEVSVPLAEFSSIPKVGDEITIAIIGESPQGILGSRLKAERKEKIAELNEKLQTGEPVKGTIVKALFVDEIVNNSKIKTLKGFLVDLGTHLKGFLPASQVELGRISVDPTTYVGKDFEFKVVSKKEGQFVLSRKELLKEITTKKREEFFEKVQVGDEVSGKVKKITEKYLVLDIEGVNGILRISDFSWSKVSNISSIVNIGDTINVKILNIIKDKGYLLVGRKQLEKDPFEDFKNSYSVDSIVTGKVISVKKNYAVVELTEGVRGVILSQDLSWSKKSKSLTDEFSVGDVVKAKVLDINNEKRLVRLSVKHLAPDPWESIEERYKKGQVVRGRINTITEFALFVDIAEGIEGIVRKEEISWDTDNPNLRKLFMKGQMVEAVITGINKPKRVLVMSIRKLTGNPWERFAEMNPVGSIVEGVVEEVKNDKVILSLGGELKGYIPSGHFSLEKNIDVKERFKVGESVKGMVLKVVPSERIIEISIRNYEKKLTDEAKKDFVVKDPEKIKKGTLADLLKQKGLNITVSEKPVETKQKGKKVTENSKVTPKKIRSGNKTDKRKV